MQTFTSILKLEVEHGYYRDGQCRDLVFTPSPETEALIKGHRLRVKYRPTGLEVFAPLAGTDLLIPIAAGTLFRWFMQARSALFQAVTAWPEKNGKGPFIISNKAGNVNESTAFDDFGGLATRTTITLNLETNRSEQNLTLRPVAISGATIKDFTFSKENNTGSFDPNAEPSAWSLTNDLKTLKLKKSVDVETRINVSYPTLAGTIGQDTQVQISYPVSAPGGRGQLAYVDLYLEAPVENDSDTPLAYTLNFEVKQEHWLYLVVCKNGGGFNPKKHSMKINKASTEEELLDINVLELTGDSDSDGVSDGDEENKNIKPSDLPLTGNEESDSNSNILVADQAWEKLIPTLSTSDKAFFIRTKAPIPYRENTRVQLQNTDSGPDETYFLPGPDPLNHGFSFVENPRKQ